MGIKEQLRWQDRAECLNEDPEMFFPVASETTARGRAEVELAKEVCRRCGVRPECLAYAIINEYDHGVFGGLSENERKRLKRKGRVEQR